MEDKDETENPKSMRFQKTEKIQLESESGYRCIPQSGHAKELSGRNWKHHSFPRLVVNKHFNSF